MRHVGKLELQERRGKAQALGDSVGQRWRETEAKRPRKIQIKFSRRLWRSKDQIYKFSLKS